MLQEIIFCALLSRLNYLNKKLLCFFTYSTNDMEPKGILGI